MYGTLDAISSGPVDARIYKNSTMVGRVPVFEYLLIIARNKHFK